MSEQRMQRFVEAAKGCPAPMSVLLPMFFLAMQTKRKQDLLYVGREGQCSIVVGPSGKVSWGDMEALPEGAAPTDPSEVVSAIWPQWKEK